MSHAGDVVSLTLGRELAVGSQRILTRVGRGSAAADVALRMRHIEGGGGGLLGQPVVVLMDGWVRTRLAGAGVCGHGCCRCGEAALQATGERS